MKRRTKYLIARSFIAVVLIAVSFGIGKITTETEVVEVKVESPAPKVCRHVEIETEKEPMPQYRSVDVVATAYCPCSKCCGKSDGITATGVKAKARHTIAADPKFLPYGTKVLFDCNEWVVEDCGGAIKGENRIDIFFDTHQEAVNFGKQTFTIWIEEV